MYNSRPSSSSPYSRSPEAGNSGKYQNKSISKSFKSTTGTATKSANGMTVVRGNKGVSKAIGGAAAPIATVAPIPINTPSVKRENNGRDPSVNLVPATRTSSGVWGQNSSGNEDSPSDNNPTSQQPTPTTSTFSKPAPWAKAPSRDAGGAAESAEMLPPPAVRAPITNWAEDVESDEDEDSSAAVPQSREFHTAGRQSTCGPQQSRASDADQQRNRKERSGSFGDHYHDDGGRYGRAASGDARHFNSNYQNDYGRSSGSNSGAYSNSPNYGGIAGPGSYRNAPNRGSGPDRSFGHMQQYGSGKFDTSLSAEQRAIEEARQEAELLEAKKLRKRTMSSEGVAAGGYSTEKRPEEGSEDRHSGSRHQGGFEAYSGYGNERRDYGRSSNSNRGREDYPSSTGGGYAVYGGMSSGGTRIPHRTRGPSFDHEPSVSGASATTSESNWERAKRPEPPAPSAQSRITGLAITSPFPVSVSALSQLSLPSSLQMHAPSANHQQHADVVRVKRTRGPTTPRESSNSEEANRSTAVASASDAAKSYSSLFERKEQQQLTQEIEPFQQQHVQFLHKAQNDPNQRVGPPQSTPPESRRKMLFDPQSNVFRELGATDKPNTGYSRKMDQDRADRRTGPPAVEGTDAARKTLQVQRIEQNTGEKWVRQTISKPVSGTRIMSLEAENSTAGPDDDHDTESVREDEMAVRRAARARERAERGPRTKGFLFHYNAEGEIERVFTPEEKVRADALKQRKLEKAERDRKQSVTEVPVEELPLHLPPEQFKTLTVEQKHQLKERQLAARDSTQKTSTTVTPPAVKKFDPTVEFTTEEYRALSKEQKEEVRAHQMEQKEARKAARAKKTADKRSAAERTVVAAAVSELEHPLTTMSLAESRSLGSSELDIQKVALETEATRSKQPVKAFVPGQSYQTRSLVEPTGWDSAGLDVAHSHWDDLSNRSYAGNLAASAPQPMYTSDSATNWSSYKSVPGAPEPALFGGNTSFLGNQETSLGSRFAALASGRGDSDEEEYEDVEEEEQQELQEEERSSVRRLSAGRGGRTEFSRAERGGRGRGRGYSGRSSRSGPPAVPADSDLAASAVRGYRSTGRSSGRGGRESSRAENESYASQYSSSGRGRGSSSRSRGGDNEATERPARDSTSSAGRSTGRLGGRGGGRATTYQPRTAATTTA